MKKKIFHIAQLCLGWPLTIISLIIIGRILLQQKNVFTLLDKANGMIIVLSILSFLLYFFLRGFFWQQLLHKKGYTYSYIQATYQWTISEIKRYVPGNIWSFVGRGSLLSDTVTSKKSLIQLLLWEVEFLLVACCIISYLSLNFLVFGLLRLPVLESVLLEGLLLFAGILLVLLFMFHRKFFKKGPLFHALPNLPFADTLQLLTIMSSAFFCFGIGTYFAIASFTRLYFPHIFPLAGFFTFSFLVGYLSLITPMGLGVREAIMTSGLSKYLSLTAAALGAIFTRIILIASELLFFTIVVLLYKVRLKVFKKIEVLYKKYSHEMLLGLGAVLYTIYFTLASFLRYSNFFTGRFDLGNMDQTVWNTIHGRFFQLTNPDGTNIISRLSFHADYILAIISPLYLIWQDPRMLLVIQTVTLAIGGIFVFLIAKQLLQHKQIALIFAALYFINPAVNLTNLYDFHGVTLATTFLLGAYYFLIKKNYTWMVILLFLAGTTKEEIWLIVGMIGMFIFFIHKKRVLGATIALLSFFLFYYIFWHAIPTVRGGNHFALSYYSDFGSSNTQVLKNIILSPVKTLKIVFQNGRLIYLLELLSPLSFLSFLSPLFLLFVGPEFAINLLSQNSSLHNIHYQYSAAITPFLFISSIYGFSFLQKFISEKYRKVVLFLMVLTGLTTAYIFGPLPGSISFDHDMFTHPLIYRDDIDKFLATIPLRYSVAATNNVGSHLSHRQKIFTIPVGIDQADVLVFLLTDQFAQPSLQSQRNMVTKLEKDNAYAELFHYEDFYVFAKKGLAMNKFSRKRNVWNTLFPIFK